MASGDCTSVAQSLEGGGVSGPTSLSFMVWRLWFRIWDRGDRFSVGTTFLRRWVLGSDSLGRIKFRVKGATTQVGRERLKRSLGSRVQILGVRAHQRMLESQG